MSLSTRAFALLAVVVLCCLHVAGCGPGYATTDVTGQVTYNGKPLDKDGGAITFYGPRGGPITAPIDRSGKYSAVGVSQGENKVTVIYARPVKIATKKGPKKDTAPSFGSETPFLTPEAYASPQSSELKVVVGSGTTYDPKLTGPEIN
jgi:hypothetical protein